MKYNYFPSFLLRIGLSIVFLYAAISSFLSSTSWVGFIPKLITLIIPTNIFLPIYGIYQIGLSFWLLSGKKTYHASILASITLILIIIFNISALDLVFRDIAILSGALALIFLTKEK